MWLITTFIAALLVTAVYIIAKNPKKYKIGWLSLMLWSASLMVLVDHILGYLEEGGEFLEYTTEGLVTNGIVLGVVMLIPVFTIWEVVVLFQNQKENWLLVWELFSEWIRLANAPSRSADICHQYPVSS